MTEDEFDIENLSHRARIERGRQKLLDCEGVTGEKGKSDAVNYPPFDPEINGLEFCPHCGVDFKDSPIPIKDRHLFGGSSWFKREMAIYDLEKDRTVDKICPDCKKSLWKK